MYEEITSSISKVSDGKLPFPLREKRSRYTHLNEDPKPKTIVIHNPKYIITADENREVQVKTGLSIYIEDGMIREVFDPKKNKIDLNKVDVIYDGGRRSGLVVTPGFINAHAHPPMYMLRSSLMLEKGENLEKTLRDMYIRESQMNDDDLFISAVGDLTEEQKNGITTTLSHYATFDSIEAAAAVAHQNVINAISAVSNSHPENTPANVEKLLRRKDKFNTQIAVAIHTLHKAEPAVLKRVAAIVKKNRALFTTHVAETRPSIQAHLKVHGDLPVQTLKRYGLDNSRTIMSHCVHLTEEEIEIVAKKKMGIVHLPTSNKLHRSGEFPYPLYVKHGVTDRIALGTDSVISKNSLDILSEALQARIMHQDKYVVFYEELFKMMTCNAADVLHMQKRGRVAPGYHADLAFWKLRDRGFMPFDEHRPVTLIGNMITHGGRNVRDLMIDGEFVISNRRHNFIDESSLLTHLQNNHQELRKRVKKFKTQLRKKGK